MFKQHEALQTFWDTTKGVENYDIIVQGHLRWNRYFGEGPQSPPRGDPSTCSSTLVRARDAQGNPYCLLVDPTLRWTPKEYYFDLNRRTGLKPPAVTHCFSTHEHGDHIEGLAYFPDAMWLAGEGAVQKIAQTANGLYQRIRPVSGEFLPDVFALCLPGHTLDLHGIAFAYRGKKYLVAGDGVMTKEHFWNETTEFEKDAAMAAQTIRDIKSEFDFVIPGHDGLVAL